VFAKSLDDMGVLHHKLGNYTTAESFYRQALEIRREALGDKNIVYADSLNGLASLYLTIGKFL